MYSTIVEAVLDHASKEPQKIAIGFKDSKVTYQELAVQMKTAAYLFSKKYNISSSDKVIISAISKIEYIVSLLGVQYLNAISVPIDKSALEKNICDIYQFISPKLLLTDNRIVSDAVKKVSLSGFYEEVLEESGKEIVNMDYVVPKKESVAEMLFTTGTTGTPKGAMLTYGNIYASTHNTWHGVHMEESDVVLIPLPLNHSVGMRVLRTILYIGATVILQNGFMFPKELTENVYKFSCTALVGVPASLELLMRQMGQEFVHTLGRLRYIEVGAGSLSYDMKKKLVKILPNTIIYNTWGSTETGGAIFLNVTEHPDKLASLGKPAKGVRLKVVDEFGKEIKAKDINTAGRMVLQGDMQMAGYYNLPEINAATLVDGWLYTNDLVYTDEDGYVYMLGRADDIINVGGEKVSPLEVENIASESDQIRECACIGVSDPEGMLGQVPVLYVVPEGADIDKKQLARFLSERLESYKLPHKYVTLDELPRNRMKKLDRKTLHEMWNKNGEEDLINDTVRTILNRHSVREFDNKRISRPLLEMIVKAGIQAPSSHNMQTWRFTIVRNKDKIEALKCQIKETAEEKKVHFYGMQNPDTLILISNDRRNENGIQDSSCAAENIMLAAQAYRIGSVWINALKTICDEPKLRDILTSYGIPQRHVVWSVIAMGYPAGQPKIIARKPNVVGWVE